MARDIYTALTFSVWKPLDQTSAPSMAAIKKAAVFSKQSKHVSVAEGLRQRDRFQELPRLISAVKAGFNAEYTAFNPAGDDHFAHNRMADPSRSLLRSLPYRADT